MGCSETHALLEKSHFGGAIRMLQFPGVFISRMIPVSLGELFAPSTQYLQILQSQSVNSNSRRPSKLLLLSPSQRVLGSFHRLHIEHLGNHKPQEPVHATVKCRRRPLVLKASRRHRIRLRRTKNRGGVFRFHHTYGSFFRDYLGIVRHWNRSKLSRA